MLPGKPRTEMPDLCTVLRGVDPLDAANRGRCDVRRRGVQVGLQPDAERFAHGCGHAVAAKPGSLGGGHALVREVDEDSLVGR